MTEYGPDKEVVARIFVCPSEDVERVREAGRFAIAAYLNVPVYAAFHEWLGRGPLLQPMWDAWQAGDRKAALAAIPDEVVDDLIVHGSPARCRATIQRYFDNGVTTSSLAILPLDPALDHWESSAASWRHRPLTSTRHAGDPPGCAALCSLCEDAPGVRAGKRGCDHEQNESSSSAAASAALAAALLPGAVASGKRLAAAHHHGRGRAAAAPGSGGDFFKFLPATGSGQATADAAAPLQEVRGHPQPGVDAWSPCVPPRRPPAGAVGLHDHSLGVKTSAESYFSPSCARVDGTEALTLALGSTLGQKKIDFAELDIEAFGAVRPSRPRPTSAAA